MTKKNSALMIVTALFVTFYLVSNIMAVKIIGFYNLFYFDAGTITFPFAYMLGDLLTEIWGYRTAKKVIFLTFICNNFKYNRINFRSRHKSFRRHYSYYFTIGIIVNR